MKLKVLYEDEDVVVMMAPHDDELQRLVLDLLREKGRPMRWSELRETFSGIAGEDRLRRTLYKLVDKGLLVELPGNRYGLPDMPGVMEELREYREKRRRSMWFYWRRKKPVQAGVN
jgi:hypothetical protein